MSKKHTNSGNQGGSQSTQNVALSHEAEYRIIKFDLIKVLILNVAYLAIILGLYFGNQKSQFLEHWFAKILHF
jgi:hypothetical protein